MIFIVVFVVNLQPSDDSFIKKNKTQKEISITKEKTYQSNKPNKSISKSKNPFFIKNYKKPKHVFIDCGTNDGKSVKNFIELSRKFEVDNFFKSYGYLKNKTWEIHILEANPYFNKILKNLKKDLVKQGHTVILHTKTAAWTKNENLRFYLDKISYPFFWGSSLIKDHPDIVSSNYANIEVSGIDLAELVKMYDKDDEIVMKIDIEGTEYPLLLHLIKENALNLVDILAVEYHREIVKDMPIKIIENFVTEYLKYYNISTVKWQ